MCAGYHSVERSQTLLQIIDALEVSRVRVVAWGYESSNGSYSYARDRGTSIQVTWPLSTLGAARHTESVPISQANVFGDLDSRAAWFVLDAVM